MIVDRNCNGDRNQKLNFWSSRRKSQQYQLACFLRLGHRHMATPGLVADLPRGYSVRSDQASHPRAVEILRSFASRYQTQKHSGFPEAQSTFWRTRPRADDEQEKEMDRSYALRPAV